MVRFAPAVLAALIAASSLSAQERDDPNKSIDRVLAIQAALYEGRQQLQKGDAKKAVAVLEAELPNSNGNRDYLAALRDAYWAYLKDLQRAQQNDQVSIILGRLRRLDPTAKLDGFAAADPKSAPPAISPIVPAPEPPRKARGQADDSDPFQQTPVGVASGGPDLVRRAVQAFDREQFTEAGRLFEQANAKDPAALTGAARGQWAYCRLAAAVERLPSTTADGLPALEEEVRQAIALAADRPQVQTFGQTVLDRIRAGRPTAAPASPDGDWSVFESTNFRVMFRSPRESAERFAAAAEKARSTAFDKWFGSTAHAWSPRCDVYVYPTADEYVRSAKGHPQSHGYSTVDITGGRTTRRRIDLAGDNPQLLTAALPREVTHVVLADIFPDPLLPRWADESMAILAEPRANVERYLRLVPRCRREGKLFPVGSLVTSTDFPDAAAITGFYAESVSLVDMLVAQGGEKAFSIFLRDAPRYGYEKALQRNYQIKSFQELQDRWQRHTLVE
jgi:tetratricopeptide (TPR) repeat protein